MLKQSILFISILLSFTACKKNSDYEGDHFFVDNDGAIMPVIVKGNINSNVFVIFLHGGPGGNATQATFIPVFQELGDDFAMVYWDQRGSGMAQGNPDPSTFTVDQFVEDLDLVVETIKVRYDNPTIFLFGHSWGGALGCAYMSTDKQSKINGFINMNSGHNLLEGLPLSVDWVENYAQTQVDINNDIPYWSAVRNWCAANPDMTVPDNYFQYVEYLKNTNAYRVDPDAEVESGTVTTTDVMSSYMSLSIFFNGGYLAQNFNILELNLSPQMANIYKQTLVLWGEHDGVNTLAMGNDAYNSIGGPSFTDKALVILPNSAHEGYFEDKELFQSEFRKFVNTYK